MDFPDNSDRGSYQPVLTNSVHPYVTGVSSTRQQLDTRIRKVILAIGGASLLVLALIAASGGPSLWKTGCDAECLPKTVEFSEIARGGKTNLTDNYDEIAERLAESWPGHAEVKSFKRQAVASDVALCSTVGNDILELNGTAADAAVATVLCMGIVHPHSSGIGGGMVMVYYDKASRNVTAIDARETAPAAASETMYVDTNDTRVTASHGWASMGVPGELAGLWELHKRFGKLPWKDLFQPAIKLAKQGFPVTQFFGLVLAFVKKDILHRYGDDTMWNVLLNKTSNETHKQGDIIRMEKLAETLRIVSEDPLGVHEFYHGKLAQAMVNDIREGGGIMTLDDFKNYTPRVQEPIVSKLRDNSTLYGLRPPSGNAVFHRALLILEGYCDPKKNASAMTTHEKSLFYHHFVESLKSAYALRGDLADDRFVKGVDVLTRRMTSRADAKAARKLISDERTYDNSRHYGATASLTMDEGGTGQVAILDKFGNAASISVSVNTILGAFRISNSTGVVFNNHMDDFTTDPKKRNLFGVAPSEANKIEPGKRPQSTMSPLIIVDPQGDPSIVAGGTGGTKIVTGLMNVIGRMLCLNVTLKEAMEAPRLHHQMSPNEVVYEQGLEQVHVDALRAKGHTVIQSKAPRQLPWSAIEVIQVDKSADRILAVCDQRKGGLPDGV